MTEERYYFDANALVKCYKNEEGSLEIRRLVSSTVSPILVSELTLLECFSVIMKEKRRGNFRLKRVRTIYQELKKIVNARSYHFELISTPEEIFPLAHEILLNYAPNNDFGSHDALHLAIVKKLESQAIMVTSDKEMKNVCKCKDINFYDPEFE